MNKCILKNNASVCGAADKVEAPHGLMANEPLEGGIFDTPCFTPGTKIKTDGGEVLVENIDVGHRVLTRDNGYQTVRWIGRRDLDAKDLADHPDLQPIEIKKNALGENIPERDMHVSPQHRMLLNNDQIRSWLDSQEALVAAHLLTCFAGIESKTVNRISYIHFMFDQHEIVLADGAWSESYQPRDLTSSTLNRAIREELFRLFPELETDGADAYPAAREDLTQPEMLKALSRRP